jgi:hypothetical protein
MEVGFVVTSSSCVGPSPFAVAAERPSLPPWAQIPPDETHHTAGGGKLPEGGGGGRSGVGSVGLAQPCAALGLPRASAS